MNQEDRALQALRMSGLAAGLTDEDVGEVLSSSRVRELALSRGELVFADGDMPKRLYILLSGEVHIRKDTYSGRTIFISEIADPGDLFGEIYMVLQRPYDMYVEAAKSSRILAISSEYFKLDAGKSHTALLVQQNLMKIFARKAFHMHTRIKILASGTLRERIVRFLFQSMDEKGELTLSITREYMADYLAATRPSLSRELSAMQRDGLLAINGKHVKVTDMAAFEACL